MEGNSAVSDVHHCYLDGTVHSSSTAAHSGDRLWKTKTGLGVVKHLQNWTNWTQGRGNSKKF